MVKNELTVENESTPEGQAKAKLTVTENVIVFRWFDVRCVKHLHFVFNV